MRPKELYSMCDEWNNIFLVVAVEKCKRGMAKSHKKSDSEKCLDKVVQNTVVSSIG